MAAGEGVPGLHIRPAMASDAEALSVVVYSFKAYWGYSSDFMQSRREELSVTKEYMREHATYLMESAGNPVAFCSLEERPDRTVELGYFCVDSSSLHTGCGKQLLEYASQRARRLGAGRLLLSGDPNAEEYYLELGLRRAGSRESEDPSGRQLPLFEIDL